MPKQGEDKDCKPVPPVCVPKQGEDKDCKPVPPVCVPKQGEDKDCKPVPPVCVPKQGEDKDCKPVPPVCVPKQGEDKELQPGRHRVRADDGEPVRDEQPASGRARQPGDQQAARGGQGHAGADACGCDARRLTPCETPAAVKPAAGALPSTGVGLGLELLGLGGVVLLAAGAATVGLRRRVVRG